MSGSTASRNITALSLYSIMRGAGVGAYRTLLPLYLLTLGYSLEIIGGIATLALLANVVLLPLLGLLIDSIGRKIIAGTAGLLISLALFIPASFKYLPLLIASYILFYISWAMGQPARSAMLADSVPAEKLGTAFSIVTLGFTASRIFSPYIAGWMAEAIGYRDAFLAFSAVVLAGVLAFMFIGVETRRVRSKPGVKEIIEAYKAASRPPRRLRPLYVFTSVDRASWSLWMPLLSAYFGARFGLTPADVGLLLSVSSAAQSIMLPLAGRLVDRLGAFRMMLASEVLGIASALSIAFSAGGMLYASMIIFGASLASWIPAYNAIIASLSEADVRGRIYSSVNMIRMASSVPSPWIGGTLYHMLQETLPQAPFILSSVVMSINVIYMYGKKTAFSEAHPVRVAELLPSG